MKSRLKVIISSFLVLSLVVLSGCQALGGIDFNQVFKNSLKVTSSVGSSALHFKLDVDQAEAAKLDEESLEVLNLLSDVSLTFEDVKVQDASHASMKGNLSLSDQISLDFNLQLSEEIVVIWIEGAKQPFSLDLTGETSQELLEQELIEMYGYDYTMDEFSESDTDLVFDQEQMLEAIQEVTNNVAGYIIEKLPNAEKVSVDFKSGSVNGQFAELFHVQAELDGSDLFKLIEKFVAALLADREGIEKLVVHVIEVIDSHPQLQGMMMPYYYEEPYFDEEWYAMYEEDGEYDAAAEEYMETGSKAEAEVYEDAEQTEEADEGTEADSVEPSPVAAEEEEEEEDIATIVVDEIMTALQSLSDELTNFKTDEESKEIYEAIFGDALKLKVDLHIDQKLHVRKSAIEIAYTFTDKLKEELETSVINGFTFTLSNAVNDINEAVVADKPVVTADTVSLESLSYLEDYETIQYFEEGSWLHSMISQYGDMTQSYWKFDDEEYNPILMHGGSITMVPLREVIEEFRGDIEYIGATKQIIVTDNATGTIIELQVGSPEAKVNGEVLSWPIPVEVIDGTTYVPARALAEALGAQIYWEDYDDVKCLNIEREL